MMPICHSPDGLAITAASPAAILPGSFNPLHVGHRTLAAVAAQRLGVEVHFEISVANVDKPELPPDEVARRVEQFRGVAAVWVTRAATFAAKAELFPGTAFVLGWDTAIRLVDARYYSHDANRRDAALRMLMDRGCHVLVGGRRDASGAFRVWDTGELSEEFTDLFVALREEEFRADVSSTELRGALR